MKKLNQAGALHLAVLIGLVVVAVVAFAGYRVMSSDDTANTTTASASDVPAKISNQADLTQTSKALDDTDSQLDASLNDAALDSDINAML